MAKEAYYSTIPESEKTEPMRFRIHGLRPVGNDEFEIEAKPLHLDLTRVSEMLDEAGIDREESMVYAERFYRMVQTGELARLIASRMERMG